MSRIRVLIIESGYYSRYALHSLLSKDKRIMVVDGVRDIEEARWLLDEGEKPVVPQIILFDIDTDCQHQDPIEAIKRLVSLFKTTKHGCRIVCFVIEPSLTFIRSAVELGVDALLQKEEVASSLADVLEKVHQGVFVYTRAVGERAFGRFGGVQHEECYMVPPRRTAPLSHSLRRVARWYCEDNMTATEVAEILHLSESGVRRQIRQIYRNLGVHSRREARRKLYDMEW
jgi:DNA-binding NarL/FixJ family response regulator